MPSRAARGWYITDDHFLAGSVWNAYRWLSRWVGHRPGVYPRGNELLFQLSDVMGNSVATGREVPISLPL